MINLKILLIIVNEGDHTCIKKYKSEFDKNGYVVLKLFIRRGV